MYAGLINSSLSIVLVTWTLHTAEFIHAYM